MKNNNAVWGIDPGLNGALALLFPEDHGIEIFDMPIMEVKKKKTISAALVADILKQHEAPVFIENVHAMPNQGVTSMFNFGKGFGILIGVVAGLNYQLTTVQPLAWKKALKVPSGKDGSRERATQLLPASSQKFARKKDDGRAEASLIALYGFTFAQSVE